jgi:hypothetical protein
MTDILHSPKQLLFLVPANHTRIHKLVIKGDLPAYSIPLTKKLRVKKSELLAFI